MAGSVVGLGDGCADAAAADDDDLHDGSSGIGSRTTQTAHGAFCRTYGMVRPMANSPPNRVRNGHAQDEQVGVALDRLVDDGGADVTRLEQDRLEGHLRLLGDRLGGVEHALDLLGATGDVGVERQRPVDLDDVDGDQLGLA